MNRSKAHNECHALTSFRTATPSPCVEKLAFMKIILGAKKLGDRCSLGQMSFSLIN